MTISRWTRGCLAAALLVAAASSDIAHAQQKLRIQSAFPPSSMIHENAKFWAERVKAMSGGRLDVELPPSGAVVPPSSCSMRSTRR